MPVRCAGPRENGGFAYRAQVGPGDAGATVLAWLTARYPHSAAPRWAERIRRGQVRLDDEVARPDDRLRAGQRLVWHRPPWREEAVPLTFAVLAADADVLAVAKPRGLPTAPAGGFLAHTLLARVRRRWPTATPAHRLGRGTSGIVLFGLSPRARRALAAAWRAGHVARVYRARIRGHLPAGVHALTAPIGPVPHPVLGTVHGACADGRPARTVVRALWRAGGESVVEVAIATGRPHQIRIHLAAAGHPLVGDPLYGPGGRPRPESRALPGDGGYLLHATRLVFPHPVTGARTAVDCAPPPALRDGGP